MKIAGETGAGGHAGVKEATVYSAGLIPCETWATGSEGVDKALWDAELYSHLEDRGQRKRWTCIVRGLLKSRKNGQVP